ncbi:MAG TPA: VWA domain-containing protein [Pyrinomonadaceae bacterium]|jgi:VWFA-related protein
MSSTSIFSRRSGFVALLCLAAFVSPSYGQQNPPAAQDDVLRINTELVQTSVTVFDKQGRFVEGLKPEQFELRVEGKPVQISFFERVKAGTNAEETQVTAARAPNPSAAPGRSPAGISYRGRTIVFFIDDLHLSLESLGRTRDALNYFIEKQMMPQDQVAFVTASGQIGFLQQFTDNQAVLRAALARVRNIPNTTRDSDQPPMTEYVAIRIINGDRDAAGIYIDKIIEGFFSKKYGGPRGLNRNAIFEMVKTRASHIVFGIEAVTDNSLKSLQNMLRITQEIPGRKLVFLLSDGFYLDTKKGGGAANIQLQRVTDTAARTGSVIYTIDARGLFAPIHDATGEKPFDPYGRLDRATMGESTLSQDGLNALAGDTGGRFLKNQNYFDNWVGRVLDETSNYYLLAWRPEAEPQQNGAKFKRIEASIVGRPDLTVRLPRGFLAGDTKVAAKSAESSAAALDPQAPAAAAKGTEADIRAALSASAPKKGLPTQLSVSFVDVPGNGPLLTASTQMATDVLGYGPDGRQPAAIDLAGVVLSDRGKQVGGFKTRINVNPLAADQQVKNPGVIYSYKVPLKPGIYQVRVAARDDRSGRVGSTMQWIEIPDLSTRRLTLSSLLIGGQLFSPTQKQATGGAAFEQVQFSVDRRFASGSHMNFITLIYNAARGAGGSGSPDLEARIQLTRDGQVIVTSPARKIAVDASTDLSRIPYGADIALKTLPAGHYLLKVIVNDRNANTSASQQVAFDIE